jgi:hypothetical protein
MASTDPFRKVHSGEPFHMSAAAYNAFVDAARAHAQQHLFDPPRRPESPLQGQVLVRNDTGEPRDRYSVLGITGPLIDPADNLPEFQRILGVQGVTPTSEHAGRFVILLEPLGAGSIGRACIDGVCPVQIEIEDEAHSYAEAAPGLIGRLQSAESGTARILWVQPEEERTDDIGWGLVRIGGGGGGSSSVALMFGQVQSASGTTPPYLYALRQVTHLGGYLFGEPYGLEIPEAYNLSEIGSSGTGVAPIPVGDIVMFWLTAAGGYVFDRHWYRGTYG